MLFVLYYSCVLYYILNCIHLMLYLIKLLRLYFLSSANFFGCSRSLIGWGYTRLYSVQPFLVNNDKIRNLQEIGFTIALIIAHVGEYDKSIEFYAFSWRCTIKVCIIVRPNRENCGKNFATVWSSDKNRTYVLACPLLAISCWQIRRKFSYIPVCGLCGWVIGYMLL